MVLTKKFSLVKFTPRASNGGSRVNVRVKSSGAYFYSSAILSKKRFIVVYSTETRALLIKTSEAA